MNIRTPIASGSRKGRFVALAAIVCLLLSVPLVAMLFTDEVNWGVADFAVMGFLLFGMGGLFILLSGRVQRRFHLPIGLLLAVVFLYLWAELAVGIFTDPGR